MSENEKIKLVQDFIFDDEVQDILSKINDNVMGYNILEITGMGTQEIKHSNILGWLFGDNEHNLEYQILDNFLKKVIQINDSFALKPLQEYLYLSDKRRDLAIYREKDNIDLLIVDELNKIVITIENKVYASERVDGKGGGQLSDYEEIINEQYEEYKKYFIFLTIHLEKPSQKNWLIANYQIIADVIKNLLKTKDVDSKTKIILESYIDLLKRRAIVEDKELKQLCEKIWLKKEYAKALNILIQHKTTITKIFYDNVLKKELDFLEDDVSLRLDGIEKLYNLIGLNWEECEDYIFDVTCEYIDTDIVLYYSHNRLYEQSNEEFINICNTLKKRKTKTYEMIKRYTMDDLRDKGEENILKDIKKILNDIDKRILDLLNE